MKNWEFFSCGLKSPFRSRAVSCQERTTDKPDNVGDLLWLAEEYAISSMKHDAKVCSLIDEVIVGRLGGQREGET